MGLLHVVTLLCCFTGHLLLRHPPFPAPTTNTQFVMMPSYPVDTGTIPPAPSGPQRLPGPPGPLGYTQPPRPPGYRQPPGPPGYRQPPGPPAFGQPPRTLRPSGHRRPPVPPAPSQLTTEDTRTDKLPRPEIRSLHILTDIQLRYAKTLVSSSLANPANESQEVFFTVVLPEKAFISKFTIAIDGKVYEAYVTEKEEARREYEAAVSAGRTAGHVAVSARDSNKYTTSVNIEAEGKVKFNLTYEELLIRTRSRYDYIVNINPGQLVRDLSVEVNIRESRNISFLKVPELRTDSAMKRHEAENSIAVIERPSPTEAYISYKPSIKQQKKSSKRGLHGQFVVQYDVERALDAGEVLVVDGYFVHFFAPVDLQPIPKHVVFVLDTSGSMAGRKLEQTKSAMITILDELNPQDLFNIVHFSTLLTYWVPFMEGEASTYMKNTTDTASSADSRYHYEYDLVLERNWRGYPATSYYIEQAKEFVDSLEADALTNIDGALQMGLALSFVVQSQHWDMESIVVLLTDGQPTSGTMDLDKIKKNVRSTNMNLKSAIFCLAFGSGADFEFLKTVSLQNHGFARKIYEASDATLQLEGFYEEISNPLLSNVTITYAEDMLEEDSLTDNKFRTYYKGSELVVAGKTTENEIPDFKSEVTASSVEGEFRRNDIVICPPYIPPYPPIYPSLPSLPFPPTEPQRNVTSLENFVERMWAYLTIKELLKKAEAATEDVSPTPQPTEPPIDDVSNNTVSNYTTTAIINETSVNITDEDILSPQVLSPREQALQLSLKYGFVTPLTSLVVVKPNDTSTTETKPADQDGEQLYYRGGYHAPSRAHNVPFSATNIRFGASSSVGLRGPPGRTKLPVAALPSPPSPHVIQPLSGRAVPKYHTTPTGITTQGPVYQFSLRSLSWFGTMVNETTIVLPPTFSRTDFMRISTTLPDVAFHACHTPSGQEGECRHLLYCILPDFLTDYDNYLQHHCEILGGYAGVCCPLGWNTRLH